MPSYWASTKSSIARLCQRLEADQRITQQPAPDDGRSRQLELTARGRQMAKNVQAASLERFRRVLAAIPAAKRRQVLGALEQLTQAVQRRDVAPTPSAAARPAPFEELDSLDQRKSLPLLPMMANHQKRNMRDHLLVVQEVVAATAAGDFPKVAEAAQRIGYSEAMGQMCEHMGAGAPGFAEQALAFHRSADHIVAAAKRQDSAGVLAALSSTLSSCTGCHATYKQQVVDRL